MTEVVLMVTAESNGRSTIDDDDNDFWWFERSTLMDKDTAPPRLSIRYPGPQGLYYCSVGEEIHMGEGCERHAALLMTSIFKASTKR